MIDLSKTINVTSRDNTTGLGLVAGQLNFSSTTNTLSAFNGTTWVNINSSLNSSLTTFEVNLGNTPRKSGSFNITGFSNLGVGQQVYISQASGPYTGKGTLADESEKDGIVANAVVTSATTIKVYWNSNTFVRGNFKFNYYLPTGNSVDYGPIYPLAGWDQTGYSWTNQGSATLTKRRNTWVLKDNAQVNDQVRLFAKTVPGSSYTYTLGFSVGFLAVNFCHAGIAALGSNGRLFTNSVDDSSNLGYVRWTDTGTFNSQGKTSYAPMSNSILWLRIRDTGTNLENSYSINGEDWIMYYSESHASWVTPSKMGPFVSFNGVNGYNGMNIVIHEAYFS